MISSWSTDRLPRQTKSQIVSLDILSSRKRSVTSCSLSLGFQNEGWEGVGEGRRVENPGNHYALGGQGQQHQQRRLMLTACALQKCDGLVSLLYDLPPQTQADYEANRTNFH